MSRAQIAILCAAVLLLPNFGAAQAVEPGSVVEAGLLLRQLTGVKRVLMMGAHPDDEDTNLLAAMARGRGAQTAYLSLTRGDGGQNLIGPELGEGLGVIRTGELEAARVLDGGGQYFTRAFDYGYSKSAEEAFQHWPRDEVLRDAVWVIRHFRPQVIVSVWSGTGNDGHGQHQAAGIIANEAFRAAADPNRFRDLPGLGGQAWQTAKLFHSVRAFRGPVDAPIDVPVGVFDPLLGRSHLQLAMDSRSQHRSQDMGSPQPLGPATTGLRLADTHVGGSDAEGIFGRIDTTIVSLAAEVPGADGTEARALLEQHRSEIAAASEALDVLHPERAAPALARALLTVRGARAIVEGRLGAEHVAVYELDRRAELVQHALMAVSSIVLDVRSSDDLIVPGQDVRVDVRLWNGGPFRVSEASAEPWSLAGGPTLPLVADLPAEVRAIEPGGLAAWPNVLRVPSEAQPDEQYFLRSLRDGDMYRWAEEDSAVWGMPRNPSRIGADARFTLHVPDIGEPIRLQRSRAARFVAVDRVTGEFEELPLITSELSVSMAPSGMAWPLSDRESREITVVLRNEGTGPSSGEVTLHAPAGWTVAPASRPFDLEAAPSDGRFAFRVTPGEGVSAGVHTLRAVATTSRGARFDVGTRMIDYPHIERVLMFSRAETRISVVPVQVAEGIRVGYVMGSGDDGLEALRQLGVDVDEVGPERLASGDFEPYDVLVLGVLAYEARPEVAAANPSILDFARRGGTVIVQYNRYEYANGGYAPYAVSMGGRPVDRVTDERSPVRFIDPESPVLTSPNRITQDDFEGWIQERGLYFLKEWDAAFTPILELTDPGEPPKLGSLVVAPVGDGVYAYVALSFFRQFDAGVPGAFRLFANLVSLKATDWNRAASGEHP
jgi:LmbE family N-acetylglucosaminyl deacetylase